MILDEIKKANIQAIKSHNKNARTVFSVVMTKATLLTVKKREKNEKLTDADMSTILQKTLKELLEEKENYEKAGNAEQSSNLSSQISVLEKYMPKLLSEQEIKEIISKQEDKSIPSVMKFFKQNYAGKVDMKMVMTVLKTF